MELRERSIKMSTTDELQELFEQIKEAEAHLVELRKEYREKRTAGLRAAIEARNEADAMIREEMKAMGYSGFTWKNLR